MSACNDPRRRELISGAKGMSIRVARRIASRLITLLATVAFALVPVACMDDLPTDPPGAPEGGILLADVGCGDPCPGGPPPGEASIALPIPPNNHSDNGGGAINWHATALTIPANHWYYVEVKEAISISSNPEYTAYYCCETTFAGTTAGPFGVRDGELKTHLGYQTPEGWYEALLTPVAGQPSKARHLVKGPATVWIKRHILWGAGSCVSGTPLGPWDLPDCPVPDGGLYYHSAGAYLLSGTHMVTVKPAAITLSVSAEPDTVVAGDSATFDATTSNGAALEVIEWLYRLDQGGLVSNPGTCQPPADPCKYAPPQSGTMYARARVGPSGAVEQASARLAVVASQLQLTCTGAQRGQNGGCTATAKPAGATIQITGWEFSSEGIGSIARDDGNVGSTSWEGVLVLRGRVSVSGTVNGTPKTASDTLSVTDRNWSGKPNVYSVVDSGQGTLPVQPREDAELGKTDFRFKLDSTRLAVITSGPNKYLGYFTDMPAVEDIVIYVNVEALREGSVFWTAHPTSVSNGICSRTHVVQQLPRVRQHEGVNFETNSHTWFYRRKLDTYDLAPRAESYVEVLDTVGQDFVTRFLDLATLPVKNLLEPERGLAFQESDLADDDNFNNNQLPCEFRYAY